MPSPLNQKILKKYPINKKSTITLDNKHTEYD